MQTDIMTVNTQALRMIPASIILALLVLTTGIKSLFLVAGIFLAWFVFRYPRVGLGLTIIAVMNLQSIGKFSAHGALFPSLAKVFGALTFLAWLFHIYRTRKQIYLSPQILAAAIFMLYAILSITYATDPGDTLVMTTKLATDFLLFFLISNLIETRNQLYTFMLLFVITALVSSVTAIVQYLTPAAAVDSWEALIQFGAHEGAIMNPESLVSGSFKRPSGTMGHHNWLSLFLISILPLSILFSRKIYNWPVRTIGYVTSLSAILATVLTHDRLGFLGIFLAVVMLIANKILKPNKGILGAALISVIIVFFILPETYKERVFSISSSIKSESTSARLELHRVGFQVFLDHPFLGAGYGNFGAAYMTKDSFLVDQVNYLIDAGSSYKVVDLGAHDMYLEMIAELGITGLALFLVLIILTMRYLVKTTRQHPGKQNRENMEARTLLIAISIFLFGAIFLHALEQKTIWILLGFATAFCKTSPACNDG